MDATTRPPAAAQTMLRRSDYDLPDATALDLNRPSATDARKAACNNAQFASLSGNALVTAVKAADTECINSLFGLTGNTAYSTFREAQMVSIATARAECGVELQRHERRQRAAADPVPARGLLRAVLRPDHGRQPTARRCAMRSVRRSMRSRPTRTSIASTTRTAKCCPST